MTNNPADDNAFEDATDELPILLDTAVLDPEEHHVATLVSVGGDDTGEHTALFAAPLLERNEELETLLSDLQSREAKIAALEQDIARLSAQWQEVERHLNAKDQTIGDLEGTVADLRRALAERSGIEPRLAELAESLEQARATADGLRHELRVANAARKAAEHALAAAKALEPSAPAGDVQALREEVAALSDYIAGRNGYWSELESRAAAANARVKGLEAELAQRERRQRRAEALAERESARAERARAALIESSRAREALEREVRAERARPSAWPGDGAALRAELESAAKLILELRAELDTAQRRAADAEHAALAARQIAETAATPPQTDAEPPAAVHAEAVARLETALEQRKQELESRDHELADRERRLATASADLDRARGELAKTRAELDDKRSDTARLERALIEKDRALEARDQRIATLQNELEEKLGALHRLNAMDLSIQGLNTKMAGRLAGTESKAEAKPSLVCISDKDPRHYVLDKSTMTIGRGSQCDIQVLTHFVSREHARLTVRRGTVLIEDLGSTNGVFVNSVRVDRQELRNSDLVTIGETQFRFLETMAH